MSVRDDMQTIQQRESEKNYFHNQRRLNLHCAEPIEDYRLDEIEREYGCGGSRIPDSEIIEELCLEIRRLKKQ